MFDFKKNLKLRTSACRWCAIHCPTRTQNHRSNGTAEKPRGLSTELTELTEIPLVGIRNIYTLIRAGSKARTQSTKTPKNKRATNATKDAMERRSRAGSRDVTPLHLAFTGLRVLQKTGENRRYKRRLELRTGFAIRRPFYHRATTHADGNESPAPAKSLLPTFFPRTLKNPT